MKSEWRVTSNFVPGTGRYYQVYRLRDKSEVDHSGNREFSGSIYDDKQDAQRLADELNAMEAKR